MKKLTVQKLKNLNSILSAIKEEANELKNEAINNIDFEYEIDDDTVALVVKNAEEQFNKGLTLNEFKQWIRYYNRRGERLLAVRIYIEMIKSKRL